MMGRTGIDFVIVCALFIFLLKLNLNAEFERSS